MANKSTKKSSSKKTTDQKKQTDIKRSDKKLDKTKDLSDTFVSDVGQKSAIANLEDEIVDKKEKRERKEKIKKEKKTHPFRTFIVMVICLVVGAVASYCYFEVLTDNNNEKPVVKCKNNKKATFGYETDSIGVSYLVNDYDYIGAFQVNLYDYLYSADKIKVKDMDQDYLKLLAIKKADSDLDGKVSSIDFNNAVDYLFGGKVEFNNDEISTDEKLCSKYEYKNGEYIKKDKDCKGTSNLKIERKIIDVDEGKNKLKVKVVLAVVDTEKNKVGKSLTLDDDGSQSIGEVLEGVEADTFVIDSEEDNLNKYTYTFKFSKANKNYYLESIELDN